jgi:N-acetylmuramoyl-L-alanine amidase
MEIRTGAVLLAGMLALGAPSAVSAQPSYDLYAKALANERELRDAGRPPTVRQIRAGVAAYERVVHRYPRSGYADNALWQAANLSALAYERFGQAADKRTGIRLLTLLKSGYPSSSLVPRVPSVLAQLDATKPPAAPARATPAAPTRATTAGGAAATDPNVTPALERSDSIVAREIAEPGAPASTPAMTPVVNAAVIKGITRTAMEDGVRVSIEIDRELTFRQELLQNPKRLFFDLKGASPAIELLDATMKFPDGDVVREIRLGRHPNHTTRVVIDTEGIDSHSVFTLYNPYRVIVDFRRSAPLAARTAPPAAAPVIPVSTTGPTVPEPKPAASSPPLPSRPVASPELSAPDVPSANSNGQFSIARQLGLGISRIVIDAGHGGHDPGAKANGLNESDLTLDVAIRLKKLLEKQPGIEVVMTRETDVFIPLEERTAIANREAADLFLSIHVNASRNANARGVETYFLNFATNPEAEAVAARENSASGRTMHSLPSIVRAIALNNKIDESRDFAATVQKSMVGTLSQKNKSLRDLGVKQAPFVVLIGAGMPSVLAEMSFVTNKQEGQLLKTGAYRQAIAQALQDAVLRYQRSLKAKTAIATRE